jgi:hypothetical protein
MNKKYCKKEKKPIILVYWGGWLAEFLLHVLQSILENNIRSLKFE